jgi:hypothetical protein
VKIVTVRDLEGAALAVAVLGDVPEGSRIPLERVVTGKGRLLHHYFGRGCREVLLDSEEFRFRGLLSTRWVEAERRWFVELPPAGASFDPSGETDRGETPHGPGFERTSSKRTGPRRR